MNMRGKEGKGKPDSCRWNTRAIHLNHSTYFQSFSLGNVIPRYQFADEKFRLRILVRSIEYKFKKGGGKKRRTLVPKWINKFQIKFTQKENKKFREEFIPIFVRIQRFLVVLDTMREYIYIYINGTYLFFLKMSFQESYIYAFPESCVSHSSHSDGQIFLFHRWWAKFNNSSYFDDDLSCTAKQIGYTKNESITTATDKYHSKLFW